ncbi:MAG: carbohydrate binding family 9 domain-containing protein, partial [Candidatus Latescibacterota bacterium]
MHYRFLCFFLCLSSFLTMPAVRAEVSGWSGERAAESRTIISAAASPDTISASAQNDKVIRACPTDTPIRLDGRLDEPAWKTAVPVSDFIQRELNEGSPPTEKTEVRILYNSASLYIGVICFDSEPDKIIHKELKWDGNLKSDDHFALVLDTFHDARTAFNLVINPNGARQDSLTRTGSSSSADWNGIWDAAARIAGYGWSAEIEVPLKTLKFTNAPEQCWGVNFKRMIRRKNEEVLWTSWGRDDGLLQLSKCGRLEGLADIRRGRQMDVKPYVLGSAGEDAGKTDNDFEYGLDVKYPLTSDLTLDFTTLTDFAQVESDREEINMTRYNLYFPEKRDFFLEGSDIFSFASTYTSPFYSRRIGITPDRRTVPILGGVKLSGKAGSYSIGALTMQTDEIEGVSSTNYSVVRLKKDVLEKSTVGIIATNVQGGGDHWNRALGADFSYRTSKLFGDKNLHVSTYLAENFEPDADRGTRAGRLYIRYPNDRVFFYALYHYIGKNYDPETGFVRRRGGKEYEVIYEIMPRPNIPFVKKLLFKPFDMNYYADMRNQLVTRETEIRPFGVELESEDIIRLSIQNVYERLDEPFDIFGNVSIPRGIYSWWNGFLQLESSPSRPVSLNVEAKWGDFYDGEGTFLKSELTFKTSRFYSLAAYSTYNDIALPAGDFIARVLGGKINLDLSTRLTSTTFIQWNNETHEANVNFRLRYIPRIGSDIYIVYNHFLDENDRWSTKRNA